MKSTLAYIVLLTVFVFTACKKESSISNESEAQTISEESAAADAEYDDITEIGFSASADLEVSETPGASFSQASGIQSSYLFNDLSFKVGACTKITVTPNDNTFPKTVVIDYGDGCVCRDGRFRKGKVILHFSAPIRRPGAVLTIELEKYFVNRVHIAGKKTIKNLTEVGEPKFAIHVEGGKVEWPNGRGFSYEAAKVFTQVEGANTRTIRDDVYTIRRESKTVYSNGKIVIKTTKTPLVKKVSCPWIVAGILHITINDKEFRIDFGNGECDNKAILSWTGGEKTIRLH